MRMENDTPISLPCPACGKGMKLTGYSPVSESVIYDFLCNDDGNRLSWRPRRIVADGTNADASYDGRRH